MIKYLLYREKTEPNWKRSNAFYDKYIIPQVNSHTHIDTYILVYVYCKWATDVLSRVYAEYIIDRVRESCRECRVCWRVSKWQFRNWLQWQLCVGQIRQRRFSSSDKPEQYSIYTYIVIIYSPMIDSTHVLSKLRLELLHDDLHRVVLRYLEVVAD